MSSMPSRRQVLRRSAALAAGATGVFAIASRAAATPQARILDTRLISFEPSLYHGWSTICRRRNGSLLLVYSGGREDHVCPFGRVELMRSYDSGDSWTYPQVLMDSAIDDRDAGILETARGAILVTTFTSLAYQRTLDRQTDGKPYLTGARRERWLAAHNRVGEARRQAELGQWMIRSVDDSVTWSARYSSIVNSPHGPIQLSDGRLLYAGKELWTGQKRVGVCESIDDGQSWRWLAEIPTRPGDKASDYHELHAIEVTRRRILVHIRNHNKENARETLQSESRDGGRTWSLPKPIGVWGLPSHLLKLADGRILMTYGHRRAPLGNQARVSDDDGRSWSDPILISADGASGDLGYPSTVQLDDGSLLTVWYEKMPDNPRAALRQARWSLES